MVLHEAPRQQDRHLLSTALSPLHHRHTAQNKISWSVQTNIQIDHPIVDGMMIRIHYGITSEVLMMMQRHGW
jgi:hypothetical protein